MYVCIYHVQQYRVYFSSTLHDTLQILQSIVCMLIILYSHYVEEAKSNGE